MFWFYRRNVQQGGVSVDGEKVADLSFEITVEELRSKVNIVVKKGKKGFRKITLN